MDLFKIYPFEFEGKKYEVRIYHTDTLINSVVFKENHPATGIRNQIKTPEAIEIQHILNNESMNYFIELSKKEISDKLWKDLLN